MLLGQHILMIKCLNTFRYSTFLVIYYILLYFRFYLILKFYLHVTSLALFVRMSPKLNFSPNNLKSSSFLTLFSVHRIFLKPSVKPYLKDLYSFFFVDCPKDRFLLPLNAKLHKNIIKNIFPIPRCLKQSGINYFRNESSI